jgi:hypothetical protein
MMRLLLMIFLLVAASPAFPSTVTAGLYEFSFRAKLVSE